MAKGLDRESEKMAIFTFETSDNIKREVKSNEFCCEDAGLTFDA